MRPAEAEQNVDLARKIAEQFGKGPVYATKTVVYRRAPHDMLGKDGYSLVSNYFARYVLPYCLMKRILTPLQTSVLSNLIGRQDRAMIEATQEEIAKEIGVARTSVGPALDALCGLNLVRKVKRSTYQLNPKVAFNGNGDEQQSLLAELRAMQLETHFPDELAEELLLFPADEAV